MTAALCVLCDRRPAADDTLCCTVCPGRLAETLDELLDDTARLDPAPVRGGGQAGGPPGFGSRSPARDDVLALTDRRGYVDPDNPGALVGVSVVLRTWRERVEDAGYRWDWTPEGVRALATWWELPDLAAALRGSLAHVRRALGEQEQTIPIGVCPMLPAEVLEPEDLEVMAPEALARPCGGEIRAKAYGQTARCTGRCGTSWRGEPALRALGERLGDAWMDLAAISRYLDVKPGTLRQWARRDGWGREPGRPGTLGRTLYRLADARASWWRAYERANPVLGPTRDGWEEATIGPLLGPHRADWEEALAEAA